MKSLFLIISIFFYSNLVIAQIDNNLDESLEELIKFIASNEFTDLKNHKSDLELIDTLFLKSLLISENNISESLLALTFATLPFDRMSIKLPILNIKSDLKLQEVESSLFNKKNANLPSNLFFDTPAGGDKDKLAHFFGNAFLAYNLSFFNVSKILGIFVELFEESFKVGGGLDSRDIEINYLGEFYGKCLNNNLNIMPSEIFTIYIINHLKFYN